MKRRWYCRSEERVKYSYERLVVILPLVRPNQQNNESEVNFYVAIESY